MDRNFNKIENKFSQIEPPKHLKRAVFQRIEKEKAKRLLFKKFFLLLGFVVSIISSVATVAFFGKEILASEFSSLVLLGLSDIKTVGAMWQDYLLSLLETLPAFSIAATLLPIFAFLMLIEQYGKLEQENYDYAFKS
jgi:hypothetical protein